jgi:hypothetical protein
LFGAGDTLLLLNNPRNISTRTTEIKKLKELLYCRVYHQLGPGTYILTKPRLR